MDSAPSTAGLEPQSGASTPPPGADPFAADQAALNSEQAGYGAEADRLEKSLAQQQEVAGKDEQNVEQAAATRAQNLQQTFQGQPPQRGSILSGMAPLLLFSAFGGKAAKLDASAMLGATTGIVKGYLSGKEEVYQEGVKQYEQAYQQWKDRQEQFDKMYAIYEDAYKGRLDYQQKALDATLRSLDEVDQKRRMTVDDKTRLDEARARIIETHDQHLSEDAIRAQMLKLSQEKAAQTSAVTDPESLGLMSKLFMEDPTNTRFTAPERKAILAYLSKHGVTADDIVSGRAKTKVAYAESRTLGTQAAQLARVENALTEPNGVGDQAVQAAAALNGSALKGINHISQLIAANVSDPALARYRVKMIALRDEYATVINKGGAPTDASRAQATEAMDGYQPLAVPAIVQAIKETAKANKDALQTAIDALGVSQPKGDAQPGAAAPAAASAPAPIQTDKPGVVSWGSLPN